MRKDDVTKELPGVPARRGRPRTGAAKSGADRMREFRAKMAEAGKVEIKGVWVSVDVFDALRAYVQRQNADVADSHVTLGDAVDRILRDRLLRKR